MKSSIVVLLGGLLFFLSSCGTGNVKEPQYREIKEVRLIEAGILQSTAGVDMVFFNPNNFGVQLEEVRGDLYIDSVFFGRFGMEEKVRVNKNAEFLIPALVKLDMIGLLKNQRGLLKKKEVMVRIDGLARISKAGLTRDFPIHFEKMENIEKFRSLISR